MAHLGPGCKAEGRGAGDVVLSLGVLVLQDGGQNGIEWCISFG
ncbi:MAG: hypothetical protein QXN05_04805 [Acidilobaceae archaeon]